MCLYLQQLKHHHRGLIHKRMSILWENLVGSTTGLGARLCLAANPASGNLSLDSLFGSLRTKNIN